MILVLLAAIIVIPCVLGGLVAWRDRRHYRDRTPHALTDPVQIRLDAEAVGRSPFTAGVSQSWTEYGRRR